MTEDAPLPALQDAVLTGAEVGALLGDVARAATLLGHSVKGGAHHRATAAGGSLDADGALLLAGHVHGLQLRYVHEGKEWWDTLLALPDGTFRLVRIEHAPGTQ